MAYEEKTDILLDRLGHPIKIENLNMKYYIGVSMAFAVNAHVQELLAKILHSQEDGHQTASIFMDLSKAFDTLNNDLLLQKMERYGIRGLPLQ